MQEHDDTTAPADLQRRHLLGLTGALLFGGLAAQDALALTQALPDTEQGAQRGGAISALVHPEPPTLAFFVNTATPTRLVASKIFDGLLDYGPDLKPRAQLAERWELSADGLQLRLWLRKNAFWHDGKPLTAADVKFSAEEVWKKHAPTGRRVFQNLVRVETPDAHAVVLHLSKPAPVVLNALDVVSAPVLPRHLYEGTDIPNNPHNNKPVGSGPFVFKEWSRGSHIALERFDKYWAPGLPYLDKLTFRVIPDVAGRAAALETGAVQYGERNPVTFADADRLARSDKLVVSTAGYNGFAATLWLIPNLRDPILGKLEVRQALLHAINRDVLVKTVWGGYAAPATGPVSSQLKSFYTPDTQQYPFDRAKAEKLLDAAGFPKKADGFRFKLTHAFIPFGDDYRRTGEFVRQSLRAVGIDLELKAQDLASWTRDVFADYNYQLVSSWGVNWADPQLGLEQHYWSKAESKGTPWQNASGYASAETDRVLEAAQVERDPARRVQLYNELQRLVQKDLPLLHLFEYRWFGVWDKRLRNVTDTYNNSQSNFARVWLDGGA